MLNTLYFFLPKDLLVVDSLQCISKCLFHLQVCMLTYEKMFHPDLSNNFSLKQDLCLIAYLANTEEAHLCNKMSEKNFLYHHFSDSL